ARAARAMRDHTHPKLRAASNSHPVGKNGAAASAKFSDSLEQQIHHLRDLMWKHVGIVRDGHGLQSALEALEALRHQLPAPKFRREREAHNLLTTALLIARSALARKESRGAHYRTDFPAHDDAHFKRHSVISQAQHNVRFE
ncbi:MAG TPA: hypothetical protein VGR50_07775, partial [Terriglobales bacterium]|nr:hypothetical protein [Terriglobales bacterium]